MLLYDGSSLILYHEWRGLGNFDQLAFSPYWHAAVDSSQGNNVRFRNAWNPWDTCSFPCCLRCQGFH